MRPTPSLQRAIVATAIALLAVMPFGTRPRYESQAQVRGERFLPLLPESGSPNLTPSLTPGTAVVLSSPHGLGHELMTEISGFGLRLLDYLGGHAYVFVVKPDAPPPDWIAGRLRLWGLTAASLDTEHLLGEGMQAFLDAEYPSSITVSVGFWSAVLPHEIEALIGPGGLPEYADRETPFARPVWVDRNAGRAQLRQWMASPLVCSIQHRAPLRPLNLASRTLARAEPRPAGLDGEGIVLAQWDNGRAYPHTDFLDASGSALRLINELTGGAAAEHATHVAGTMIGDGSGNAAAAGFAPAATLHAYYFSGVNSARAQAKHNHYHVVDNHSWGLGNSFTPDGGYNVESNEFDQTARRLLLLAVKSAGNSGSASFYRTLDDSSTAKNDLIIGAAEDTGTLAFDFSSRGPTEDGRIKPDLCANGVGLLSTNPGGGYISLTGTSMAAPSVTGVVALVEERHRELHDGARMAPDAMRCLLLHTARDMGNPGPDYSYGFGLVDLEAALALLETDATTEGAHLLRGAVEEGDERAWACTVTAGQPSLKITLGWLDSYENGTPTKRLIHDLDLEVVAPDGTLHYPWTLDKNLPWVAAVRDKANTLDNIEQVVVDSPQAGTWVIRVKGTSIGSAFRPVQGFIFAASHPVSRVMDRRISDAALAGIVLPNADTTGISIDFEIADIGTVASFRVFLDVMHTAVGDLQVWLEHDGQSITLDASDADVADDLYAIYPDTLFSSSFSLASLSPLMGIAAEGTWTLHVADVKAGNAGGMVRYAMLEVESGVPPSAAIEQADLTVTAGTDLELHCSADDPLSRPLVYLWSRISGPSVTLSNADTEDVSISVPEVSALETLVLACRVSNGVAFAEDQITITIDPRPTAVVQALSGATIYEGVPVTLDASTSIDIGPGPLTWQWTQIAGPALVIADTNTAQLEFTAPQVSATTVLRFELEVSDASGGSDSVQYDVTVRDFPLAEIVISPASAQVARRNQQQFSAEGRDVAGNPLVLLTQWSLSSQAAGSITDDGLFTAGNTLGDYQLTVTDQHVGMQASISVSVVPLPLDHIEISPASAAVRAGEQAQFSAQAFDTGGAAMDISLRWSLSTANAGSISTNGLVTGSSRGGNYKVKVRDEASGIDASATFSILYPKTMTVSPPAAKLAKGASQTFSVSALDQFGAAYAFVPQWSVSSSDAGEIKATGNFTASHTKGTWRVEVRDPETEDEASASVSVRGLDALSIDIEDGKTWLYGQSIALIARGQDQFGDAIDVAQAQWSLEPSLPDGATIIGNELQVGQVAGDYTLRVEAEGVSASITLFVRDVLPPLEDELSGGGGGGCAVTSTSSGMAPFGLFSLFAGCLLLVSRRRRARTYRA